MRRLIGFPVLVSFGLFAGIAAGQARPYDELMREIQATFDRLGGNLDTNLQAAAADAATLETLFRETVEFWEPFNTRTALEAARGAREAAAAIAAAARENNLDEARDSYADIQGSCRSCHGTHRVQVPGRAFRIKP
jgi:cytochrome c556